MVLVQRGATVMSEEGRRVGGSFSYANWHSSFSYGADLSVLKAANSFLGVRAGSVLTAAGVLVIGPLAIRSALPHAGEIRQIPERARKLHPEKVEPAEL